MHAIRRATIVDGQIVDKKDHPGTVEVPQISILLENERERLGVKTISRFTTILVEEAIMKNDPVLWKTISDDIDTKDFDIQAVHSLFSQNVMLASMWVTCMSTVKTREHVLDMLVFLRDFEKHSLGSQGSDQYIDHVPMEDFCELFDNSSVLSI